jgi:hypothetical protein
LELSRAMSILLDLFFGREDGDDMFLRNAGLLPNSMALQPVVTSVRTPNPTRAPTLLQYFYRCIDIMVRKHDS